MSQRIIPPDCILLSDRDISIIFSAVLKLFLCCYMESSMRSLDVIPTNFLNSVGSYVLSIIISSIEAAIVPFSFKHAGVEPL